MPIGIGSLFSVGLYECNLCAGPVSQNQFSLRGFTTNKNRLNMSRPIISVIEEAEYIY